MAMSERPFELKRDGGGLALFVVGAFVCVLMVKAIASEQPLDELHGTAAIAYLVAGSFGAFPCLVFAAGMGFLGARSFITASESGALRHALGLVGCAVGLSILFGAFSDTGGGRFGLLTGGALGLATHATVGGLVGLAIVIAAAWYAWLREPGELYEEQIRSSVVERAVVADPGVTAAEAAGLIPEELPQVQPLARKSAYATPLSAPTSPYPEDVRLKGQVPPGARPIANTNAPYTYSAAPRVAPEQPSQPFVEHVEPFASGSHLAAAASAAAPAAAPAAREVRALPAGVQPLEPAYEELNQDEDRVPADEALVEAAPERPSWERTGLGEDDEPVDAYGTPLSLVESLRKAQEELIAIPESPAAELVEAIVPAQEQEVQPVVADSDEEFGDDLVADDDDDDEDDEEEADEDEDEDEDEEETDEEEVELFADEEEDALLEEAPLASAAPQELEAAVMAESEEFAAADVEEPEELLEIVEELVPVSELEPPAQSEPAALAQTTIFDFTEEQAGVELFPEGVPAPPAVVAEAAELPQSELLQPAAEQESELEEGIELEIGDEPEVVLQPQAAPAERAHKTLSVEPERAKLLTEVGCLFVERGRVAVSMLQRQYGMEFDDACKVLDELQDLGLIGPYLGGQRRDILLTRDQWLEKAGAV